MESLTYLSNPIYVSGISFMICAAVAFLLRLLTRHLNGGKFALDDLLLLFAIICFYAENAVQLYSICLAKGIDSERDSAYSAYLQAVWISSAFAIPTLSLLKLSILVFYRSLFDHVRWFRLTTNWLILVVIVYGVCGTAGEICEINDPSAPNAGSKRGCMDIETYARWAIALVIFDTILDSVILALPLVICCRLHLPLWKKVSICAIFLLGGFTVATNLVRLISMYNNRDSGRVGMINELWIVVHCGCAIICICLPLYGPLIIRATDSARTSWSDFKASLSSKSCHPVPVVVPISDGWSTRACRIQPETARYQHSDEIGMSDLPSELERKKGLSEKPSVDPFMEKAAQRVFDLV